MSTTPSSFLRRALIVDAAASGATASLLVLAGGALAGALALPEGLLRSVGAVLVPFVILVGYAARRDVPSTAAVRAIIALNIAWVVASLWLVSASALRPNALGVAFIVGQAIAVAVLAAAQYIGLQKTQLRQAVP